MRAILVFLIVFAVYNTYAQQNNNVPALGNSGSLQADSSKYSNTAVISNTPDLKASDKADRETDSTKTTQPVLLNSAKKEDE